MRRAELQKRLQDLSARGFVQSERKGATGIGYTLERWLGVSENNLPIADMGGRVEIKATRSTANTLITLFTFNRSVWQKPQADILCRWGYRDDKRGRRALYSTVSAAKPNQQGLQVILPAGADQIWVIDSGSGERLASWDLFAIVGKFMAKFERLLLVHADTRKGAAGEECPYRAAQLLAEPSAQTFRKGFLSGRVRIDIRMHMKATGAVRNHGTALRVHEHDLPNLFGRATHLLENG